MNPGSRATARTLAGAAALTALSLALAASARYGLVEPAALGQLCDPDPWQRGCVLRSLVVRSFVDQTIGWVALVVGAAAWLGRSALLAHLALIAGAAGLMLYSFEPSAVGVLMGALALCRPGAGRIAHQR